jgi:GR25 family glycosyltransferase involved in LPS biosynthesis
VIGTEWKISACIASIPERRNTLEKAINSLIHQVDKIYLFLNNYDNSIAEQIKNISQKIEYIIGDNKCGDAGKFYWADKLCGYILTCDDDLVLPEGYVDKIIGGIEQYGRKAIVSLHGRTLKFPMSSYCRDYDNFFGFNLDLEKDMFAHIAGTGCMGWHSTTIKPSMNDFPSPNMADIHVSILAQKNKIPIVVLSHSGGWIKDAHYTTSIYSRMVKDDKEQTERVNGVDWKLYNVMWAKESAKGEISPSVAYIINLTHRTDRYKDVFAECIKNDIIPVRIDAIDGKRDLSHLAGDRLLQAHYGCAESHIKSLEATYDGKGEYSLIIEDDCVLSDNFKEKLSEYAKQLPDDWDLLYLGGNLINASNYKGGSLINNDAAEKFSDNLYMAKNVLTTHAYIVRNNSIPELLNVIKSRKDRIDILFCEFQKQNKCFIVYPELAWQRVGYSDIVGAVTNNIHLKYGK